MNRNLLLIVLFIIIFCWMFKVFETKNNSRNYFAGKNSRGLLQKSDYFKTTLHNNQSKDINSSNNPFFITGISDTSKEIIGMPSRKFTRASEALNETRINFDKSDWDPNPEIFNNSSWKVEDEISSNLIPTSSKELSHASEVTTDNYVNFDSHNLIENNSTILHSDDTISEGRMSDMVKESIKLAESLKETLILEASNDGRRTADDILELDMTTGRADELEAANSSGKVKSFHNQSSDGNTVKESNLEKSGSIKNQFALNFIRRKGDNVLILNSSDKVNNFQNQSGDVNTMMESNQENQLTSSYIRKKGDNVFIMNYIHDMYDIVLESFVKLEEVHHLVKDVKSEIDHTLAKIQRLSSDDETTRNSFDEKCTLHGNLDQHQTHLELLQDLKLNIDRGFLEVEEAMSDLANRLTVYEDLYQSNSDDAQLFETARTEIFRTIRTVTSLMNIVQKDSNRFLKYFPNFKIVCN